MGEPVQWNTVSTEEFSPCSDNTWKYIENQWLIWKKHIGLYALVPIVEKYKSELQGYVTIKGTIRFPLDEQLPLALIEKLVQARARKNDEAEKKTPS